MELIFDKIGQEIKIGSIIAYGHLLSRSAGLRIGKVLNIKINPSSWGRADHFAITVIGINDDYHWNDKLPNLNERKGTLFYPDRIIVLNASSLPKKYLDLFEGIKDV